MSRYKLYVIPRALDETKSTPGHIRQRIKRAIQGLANDPRPPNSKALDVPGLGREVRRLRLDRWRIVYAITEADNAVDVLAVRKRPPYDYGDLATLLEELQ